MPTYQYACTACGEQLEQVQKFTDDPLTECPACGGKLRKLFSSVGIVFKGSGFYRNDSRKPAPVGASASTEGGATSGADSTKAESGSSKEAASANGSGTSTDSKGTPPAAAPSKAAASSTAGDPKPGGPKSSGPKSVGPKSGDSKSGGGPLTR